MYIIICWNVSIEATRYLNMIRFFISVSMLACFGFYIDVCHFAKHMFISTTESLRFVSEKLPRANLPHKPFTFFQHLPFTTFYFAINTSISKLVPTTCSFSLAKQINFTAGISCIMGISCMCMTDLLNRMQLMIVLDYR